MRACVREREHFLGLFCLSSYLRLGPRAPAWPSDKPHGTAQNGRKKKMMSRLRAASVLTPRKNMKRNMKKKKKKLLLLLLLLLLR